MVGLKMNYFLLWFMSATIFIGVLGDSATTAKLPENKTKKCEDGLMECGPNCYNSKFKICNNDTVVTCKQNLQECGSRCYNKTAGESCNGGVICKKSEKICGSLCYNLIDQVCLGNNIICAINYQLCGNNQCYNPMDEICHNVPIPCPKDSELCGVKCYVSKTHKCFPGGVVCKSKDEEACGNTCYSPITHSCNTDEIHSLIKPVIVTSESPVVILNGDSLLNAGIPAIPNKGKYFSPYWPIYLLISVSVFLK